MVLVHTALVLTNEKAHLLVGFFAKLVLDFFGCAGKI